MGKFSYIFAAAAAAMAFSSAFTPAYADKKTAPASKSVDSETRHSSDSIDLCDRGVCVLMVTEAGTPIRTSRIQGHASRMLFDIYEGYVNGTIQSRVDMENAVKSDTLPSAYQL